MPRRRELTFLSDELGPPGRGPAALVLQQGVGLRADWLGRPHLPRWASKFVSISELQPHRCLHPITKQYLATSACAREPVQDRAQEQVGTQSCLVSQRPTYRRRLAPTSLSRGVEVPEQSTSHVALPLSLPFSLDCHVPPARAAWSNLPTAVSLWRDPTSRCVFLSWDSMTWGCNSTDEQTCHVWPSHSSETG